MSMYYVFKINNNNNDKKALIVKIWVDIEQKIKFCLYNKEDKIVFIFFLCNSKKNKRRHIQFLPNVDNVKIFLINCKFLNFIYVYQLETYEKCFFLNFKFVNVV